MNCNNKLSKFFYFISILMIFATLSAFSDEDSEGSEILTNISRKEIKIGQKISLTTKIKNMKDVKVLWQDMSKVPSDFDVLTKKDFYDKGYLVLDIVFTSFKPAEYDEVYFTIPIQDKSGEMIYIETERNAISVFGEISQTDLDNMVSTLKSAEDIAKIELKPEKEQEKFRFNFTPYIKIVIIILVIILVCAIAFYFLYNNLIKKKTTAEKVPDIPPFDRFCADMELIEFDPADDRIKCEEKLSLLTESLKGLIFGEYGINAPSETTKELINALKDNDFDNETSIIINKLFSEIDMIKFARAEIDFERLNFFKLKVKELGMKIHQTFKAAKLNEQSEVTK